MQCLFEGQTITSWKGHYQGVGSMPGKSWLAFFPAGRVNNLGPEYPCGHCIACASAFNSLRLYFGSDEFLGNNITTAEGTNAPEPKITSGNPGYIAGVTDVPNSGPTTVGYAPAQDVHLGWNTLDDYTALGGIARVYIGVHTPSSVIEGTRVGRETSNRVWSKVKQLFKKNPSVECKAIGNGPYDF